MRRFPGNRGVFKDARACVAVAMLATVVSFAVPASSAAPNDEEIGVGATDAGGPLRLLDPFDEEGYQEVVPGALFIKHLQGKDLSVGLYKILPGKSKELVFKPHSHGESVGIVLTGKPGKMKIGGTEYDLKAGQVMYLPAGVMHGGGGVELWGEEEIILLDIVTPPRKDWGPEGSVPRLPSVE